MMQTTTPTSSLFTAQMKGQEMVPEYFESSDNPQANVKSEDVFSLNKEVVQFGSNRHKGYRREIHIQQINDSFLYDAYKKKHIFTEVESASASSSLACTSGFDPHDENLRIKGIVEASKHYITDTSSQLDGLKDLTTVTSMLSAKHTESSNRTDDMPSELSSERSISPAMSSFLNRTDSQHVDIKNQYGINESKHIESLSTDQQRSLEKDKRAIYRHPLFPLLSILFEKCEMATKSIELNATFNFNVEAQNFIEKKIKDKNEIACEDNEVNELMIRALQVLRIHLLELEKVQDLCKDFCNRYITCLRGKMQSENLLRSDYGGYDSDDSGSGGSFGKDTSIHSMSPMPTIA